jgi:hypothetical protein
VSARWTPERESILRKLWTAGVPANAIAQQLGAGVSRNSVIGKAHRLGLRSNRRPEAQSTQPSRDICETATPVGDRRASAKGDRAPPTAASNRKERRQKRSRKDKAARIKISSLVEARRDARLAEARRRSAEARLEANRRIAERSGRRSDPRSTIGGTFDELRRKWIAATLYVCRFSQHDPGAQDVAAAKFIINEIGAEWARLMRVRPGSGEYFPWPSTEARVGSGKLSADDWEATGMLGYLGYRVGQSSELNPEARQMILSYAFNSQLPPLNSLNYMIEWGTPGSMIRLRKIAESLASFIRLRKQARRAMFVKAIEDWESDLAFLYKTYYVGRFSFPWPST